MTTARNFFDASCEAQKTDAQLAHKLLISALYADPNFAHALHNTACIQADSGMVHSAIALWRRALNTDLPPEFKGWALNNIGHRLFMVGRLDEAWEFTQQALAHDPAMAYPWENLSAICVQRGETAHAVDYARKGRAIGLAAVSRTKDAEIKAKLAARIRPDDKALAEAATKASLAAAQALREEPVTGVQLALALLNDGQYAEGLREFEARFPYGLRDFMNYPYPRWDGSRIDRLFVSCEQGLGDTLSFCRFIRPAAERVGEMAVAVPAELVRFVAPGLPGNVVIEHHAAKGPFPLADAFCPIMSLPTTLGMSDAEIAGCPDLDYGVIPQPREPGAPLRIGVSWAGAVANAKDAFRSMIIEQMMDLFAIPGTVWVSLQQDGRAEDLHRTGAIALVRDLSPMLKDAAMTAEVLANEVDLVVTIDSFLGHLAGSVGRRCLVMVARNAGDWRLGRRGPRAIDWYPAHTVLRQGEDARWEPVVERAAAAIREAVDGQR